MLRKVPLLFLALVAYNLAAVAAGKPLEAAIVSIGLPSGASWAFTLGDLLLTFGLGLLFVEVIQSTRTSATSIVNHALSTVVMTIGIVEFVTVQKAGTSVFFLLVAMCAIDVIAGFTVTISTARRDFGPGHDH